MSLNNLHYTLHEDHPVEFPSKATWLSGSPLIHVLGVTHHSLADTTTHQQRRQQPFFKSQTQLNIALMSRSLAVGRIA
jgi:hypothetical protein